MSERRGTTRPSKARVRAVYRFRCSQVIPPDAVGADDHEVLRHVREEVAREVSGRKATIEARKREVGLYPQTSDRDRDDVREQFEHPVDAEDHHE